MRIIWRVYSVYVYVVFVVLALIILPLILLVSIRPQWHRAALRINRFWSWLFFWLIFNPIKVEYRFQPKANQRYIFCANHFSYLDIPVIARLKVPFKYIGKMSVSKIPLFGLMFRRLHIMVERSSLKSRAESLVRCREALAGGFNLVIFPEGGMLTKNPPDMVNFKDGAFRLALEERVPIVPVTMPYNFEILPDDASLCFKWRPCRMIVHEPIHISEGESTIESLKSQTFAVISEELIRHHSKNVNQSTHL